MGFEDEVLVILVPGSVVGIRIQDELGVRHVLHEMERVHGINDDIVVATHDEGRLLHLFQVSKTLSGVCPPLADGCNLCGRNLVADWGVTIFGAREIALEERAARRLALLRIAEKDLEPQVLWRIVGGAEGGP